MLKKQATKDQKKYIYMIHGHFGRKIQQEEEKKN